MTESVLRASLLILFYLKNEKILLWKFNGKLARQLLCKSWPLLFSAIASIIYLKIDIIMLGIMQSGEAVGVYAAAVRISELFYFIPTIVTATLLPIIVRSTNLDAVTQNTRMQALFDVLSLYSFVSIIFILLIADTLISFLFGENFIQAALIAKIHIFALIFVASGVARNKFLIANDHTIFIMIATIVGALSNVILNYFLIDRYSGIGAAISTVVSYGISSYLSCLFWQPAVKFFKVISSSYFVLVRPGSLIRFLTNLVSRKSL